MTTKNRTNRTVGNSLSILGSFVIYEPRLVENVIWNTLSLLCDAITIFRLTLVLFTKDMALCVFLIKGTVYRFIRMEVMTKKGCSIIKPSHNVSLGDEKELRPTHVETLIFALKLETDCR